jgi:hypothetical protein
METTTARGHSGGKTFILPEFPQRDRAIPLTGERECFAKEASTNHAMIPSD